MKKSLLTLCVLAFILPLSAQVGPSVTYEKFLLAAPPLSLVEPVTGRIFSLDRYHYSPNNPTRTYSLPVWDSPVFLMESSAVISASDNTEWHNEW